MLPDFPDMKEKLQKVHLYMMEKYSSAYMGAFSDMQRYRIFEGNRFVMIREDGSVEETELAEMKVGMKIDTREIENMTPDIISCKYADAAKDMARQQTEHFYGQFDNAVSKVGNVLDANGKPFSIDHLFESLEKIQIDFDKDGRPDMPMMVVGQDIFESVSEVISRSQTDPECEKRFKELMERKREEGRGKMLLLKAPLVI